MNWTKLLPLTLLPCLAFAHTTPWTGDPTIARQELDQEWAQIEHPSPKIEVRSLFRFAVETAGLSWHTERIGKALALAKSMEDLDPKSDTFGNFKWRGDHDRVIDPDAVEFCVQLAAYLRLEESKALSPEDLASLDQLLTSSIEGIHRHAVPASSTSIFLMKGWNLIAVGEALGKPEIAQEGYRHFTDWVNFTVVNGISEYGAANDYGVDLDSLGLIARFAGRPDGRAMAETMLRYFWTDIAANWWSPGDRLGGANSRTDDYLFGRGYLDTHTWTAGWLKQKPELEGSGWLPGPHAHLVTFLNACTWNPPVEVTERIRSHVPRVVVQRWSYRPLEQRAILYTGSHVSLASSGASHGAEDRTLVANIGDSPAIPQLTLFMDGRSDPYGRMKTENAANQAKALHLTPFIATVQKGAEVLQVLSDDPTDPKTNPKLAQASGFATQLTLPAAAEVWVGNEPVAPGSPSEPAVLSAGKAVFIHLGDAAIGVRFLLALGTDGKAAPVVYISDGADLPAHRITVIHSAGPPKGRGITVVWMRVADGLDSAGFASFRHHFAEARASVRLKGADLRVEAAGLSSHLAIHCDIVAGLRHELAGSEPDALLSINGEDVGQEILEPFGAK